MFPRPNTHSMTSSPVRRLRAAFILVLAAILAAVALPAAASAAGSFTQVLCANPRTGEGVGVDGRFPSGLTAWTNRPGVGSDETVVGCGPGAMRSDRGIPLSVNLPFSTHTPSDATGGLTYTPGADTELTGAELWWAGSLAPGSDHMGFSIHGGQPVAMYGPPTAGLCGWQDCLSLGNTEIPFAAANRVVWSAPPASGFHLSIGCLIPDTSWTCQSPAPRTIARLFGARLTLADAADPDVIGAPTGSLLTDAVLRGDATVSGHFTDKGAGVYRLVLSVDGKVAQTVSADDNGHRCEDVDPAGGDAYEFASRVPCKLSVNGVYTFSTTAISEGKHQLRLTVEDAAGNSAIVSERQVTVDNIPPPVSVEPPSFAGVARVDAGLAGDPGTWSGSGVGFAYAWQRCTGTGDACVDIPGATARVYVVSDADAGHRLRLHIVATNGEGSTDAFSDTTGVVPALPVAAVDDPLAQGGATGVVSPPTPAPASVEALPTARLSASTTTHRGSVTVRYGQGATLSGVLTRPSGAPLAGVTLAVTQRERYSGPDFTPTADVTTGSNGRFVYRARGGASRTIRFVYGIGDAAEQHADVLMRVRAGLRMKMRTSPMRNGQTLRWTGLTLGRHPGGRLVEIQVRVGNRWQIACATRTSRSGGYRCAHRFQRTFVTTRYRFRARVRSQSGFPYLAAASRARGVLVRP